MAATSALSIFLLLVVLAMSTKGSSATGSSWCVCKSELPAAALQRTLDYACGHGGDCAPLLPGGQCHTDTDTVATRCSYAANSYYHNAKAKGNGHGGATCDFGGTATLTSTDPSSGTCRYPATTAPASSPAGAPWELWMFLLAIIAIFVSLCCCVEMHEQRRNTCRH
ncbi:PLASMODESMATA CALLOSE-BINDING PROTEIN 3-like [Triticum urartu]|nr:PLASMODESMATA CALLOSE-BINDING PROTEIN 3-like [Triticum dicoccoides]XP_044379050.1 PLASMODESMATA CALLOSE-BINDING PROTEIN 3-like [Triticum aestivum]XP_048528117.1 PLASMODESMATA CALLOSE-BINDING PROTEIN 3-like [Triticum urartu]XP_048528118.1 PLASMODESMATA CALLOSE-BINDING PROTEIN 3-like [Triticum urartu]